MPTITPRNEYFWMGGADDTLRILRCQSCGFYVHPPLPICPRCHSWELAPEPVSGRGTVYSFTINHYRWIDALVPPYVVAEIELEEQESLIVLSNMVDIDPGAVRVGMPVEVCFLPNGDAYIPQFRPVGRD
jgi:uncharacterized OB-fold protein